MPSNIESDLELAWSLRNSDTQRALEISERALATALGQDYHRAIVSGYRNLARLYWIVGRYDDALEIATKALSLRYSMDDAPTRIQLLHTSGLVHFSRSEYQRALDYYNEALQLSTISSSNSDVAMSLRFVGYVHQRLGDLAKARECYEQALAAAKAANDSNSMGWALESIGRVYLQEGNFTLAATTLEQATEVARDIDNHSLLAAALQYLGQCSFHLGSYSKALEYYDECLVYRKRLGAKEAVASITQNIACIYEALGDYSYALELYIKSRRAFEETSNRHGEGDCVLGVAAIYAKMRDLTSAIDTALSALNIFRKINDPPGVGRSLLFIGSTLVENKEYDRAIEFLEQGLTTYQSIENRNLEAQIHHALAEAYRAKGQRQRAKAMFEISLTISCELGTSTEQAVTLLSLAEMHIDENEFAEARSKLLSVIDIASKSKTLELVYRAHKALATTFTSSKDPRSALHHLKSFHNVKEQVFNSESDKRMKNLAVQHEVEKKEREAEIHRLKNVELVALNTELSEANRVKNEFLRVAAHDLKNPLSGIMLMSELTLAQSDADSKVANLTRNMLESSERMLGIINRLLDIAKLESSSA